MVEHARRPFMALTAVVSLGVAIFFSLYSLIPVTRTDSPQLSSLFLGTMMICVMSVQPITPTLIRKFSLRMVLANSAALMAIGALITGVSTNTPSLLIGAVAAGIGFGILIVSGAAGVAMLISADKLGRALGTFGLVTMAASALGSPAGVYIALTFSPSVFGLCATIAGALAVTLSLAIPDTVGRVSDNLAPASAMRRDNLKSAGKGKAQRLQGFIAETPWLVLCFLLLSITVLSHSLSSMPVLASSYVNAGAFIFSVQASNALGRWTGGVLEARTTTSVTIVTGAAILVSGGVLGVYAAGAAVMIIAGALIGLGIGIVQTLTLHTTMRLMNAGSASVVWNLTFDGGLWTGGILWGLALTAGFVKEAVLLICTMVVLVSVRLALQLQRKPE